MRSLHLHALRLYAHSEIFTSIMYSLVIHHMLLMHTYSISHDCLVYRVADLYFYVSTLMSSFHRQCLAVNLR
nr:MAG TPA: hypothetical protein [Caudoviricetes sp.]